MTTRAQKIVSLAKYENQIQTNSCLSNSCLQIPRYESAKTSSKHEMLKCLELQQNSTLAPNKRAKFDIAEDLMSKTLSECNTTPLCQKVLLDLNAQSCNLLTLPCSKSTMTSSEYEMMESIELLQNSILHSDEQETNNIPDNLLPEISSSELNGTNVMPAVSYEFMTKNNSPANLAEKSYTFSGIIQPKIINGTEFALLNTQKETMNKQRVDLQTEDIILDPPPLHYFAKQHESTYISDHELQSLIKTNENKSLDIKKYPLRKNKNNRYYYSNEDQEEPDPFAISDSDEYVPSDISDSSSNDSVLPNKESWGNILLSKTLTDSHEIKKSSKKPSNRPLRINTKEDLASSSDESDENGVIINCSVKRKGKRIRNKRYCCYLCQKIVVNLSRHLISMHADDLAVARILSLPKGSKRRREEFAKIMREGNFYHNCEVLQLKKGELILLRRPTALEQKKYSYINYGPCPDCLGFMLKKNIAHHIKNTCTSKTKANLEIRKPISESNAMLAGLNCNNITPDFSNNVLMRMRDDYITKICREDQLILKLGIMMYEKYSITQSELIRQSMRQLGRFFVEIKKTIPDIKALTDSLKPQYFDNVVHAVKTLCITCSNQAKRTEFQIPSLALKLGHALKKCINFERGNALRSGNIKRNRELESFQSLMDIEWSTRISSNALNTLHVRKFNCSQLLPITSDLIKLNNYLETEIKRFMSEIEKSYQPTPNYWSKFAALLLSKIVVFNKRRSGETSRITLEQYYSRPLWSEQSTEECRDAMTQFERQLAEHSVVVEVLGKRGRKVPILLSPDMKKGIDILLKTRTFAGISKDNPYVFARSGNLLEHMRGHDCLRKCCEDAQLNSPENINGTKLRKYVATVTQVINLTENETDWLARHLGHDIRVHRDFYRLHESAVELTKVSRLLMAVDSGQAHKFAGRNLADIELSDLPHFEVENGDDVSDDIVPEVNLYVKSNQEVPNEIMASTSRSELNKKSTKTICTKKPWKDEEIEAVLKFFASFIKRETIPGKAKCEECMEKYPVFGTRKWSDLKFYVKNYITKIKKH